MKLLQELRDQNNTNEYNEELYLEAIEAVEAYLCCSYLSNGGGGGIASLSLYGEIDKKDLMSLLNLTEEQANTLFEEYAEEMGEDVEDVEYLETRISDHNSKNGFTGLSIMLPKEEQKDISYEIV